MKHLISTLCFVTALLLAPVANAEAVATDPQIEVNINTADADELDKSLDGIGKSKAQAIVEHRTENGAFESVDALKNVKGIGPVIVEKNRDKIAL